MLNVELRYLRKSLGMSRMECANFLGLSSAAEIARYENGRLDIHPEHYRSLAVLDSKLKTAVILEVDLYTQAAERNVILIRFLSSDEFALYEPDLYEDLGTASVHGAFIRRAKKAIERIGGKVTVAFMDSEFYQTWLSVNDLDDSREIRVAWVRQQIRGLAK